MSKDWSSLLQTVCAPQLWMRYWVCAVEWAVPRPAGPCPCLLGSHSKEAFCGAGEMQAAAPGVQDGSSGRILKIVDMCMSPTGSHPPWDRSHTTLMSELLRTALNLAPHSKSSKENHILEQVFRKSFLFKIHMKCVSFANTGLVSQFQLSNCLPGPLSLCAVLK